ncbi:MAG: winged helix-turn-helix transcriptional regulator [Clostridia bacterium]|nr:winged helix-turn-helix transcriptional regulator [Clostridia bacterium]
MPVKRNVNGNPPEMEDDALNKDKPTPMMVLNEISRIMGARIRSKDIEGVTLQKSARLLLCELAHKDDRTQLELVKATHLKAPTISVVLQKLEKEGIVSRKSDEYDLRATRVSLTQKGRDIDTQIRKTIHEEDKIAMEVLSETEYETLMKILCKIRDHLVEDESKEEQD